MTTGLLWNTCGKDLEWFRHSARSYKKFASGFTWVKCLVPNPDYGAFRPICEENGILLCGFDEWPGKGFNHHQAMQCRGDQHFPEADVIFHIDADCMFASPCSPADWLPGGKVVLPFRDFSGFLTSPVRPGEVERFLAGTFDENRGIYFWKWASEAALGFEVPRETMAWMPIAHVREVYGKTREIIEARFRKPFDEYVRGCRNEYPQSFCEFNTLGGVAYKFFEGRYHWSNCPVQGYPFMAKVEQCWSRRSMDRPQQFFCGTYSPRELFQRLGI